MVRARAAQPEKGRQREADRLQTELEVGKTKPSDGLEFRRGEKEKTRCLLLPPCLLLV